MIASWVLLGACGARTELDAPGAPGVGAPDPSPRCEEPSLGVLQPERCDPARDSDVVTSFGSFTPLSVATFGCDGVAVLSSGGGTGPELRVSLDGGSTFAPPRLLPESPLVPNLGSPRWSPFAVSAEGATYVLVEDDGRLALSRSDDLGETWGQAVDVGVTHERAWGASLLVRGDEVVVYWLAMGEGPALARSFDRGSTFGPPVALGPGINESSNSYPTVCLAGAHGTVAGWLDCTATDCAGDDRKGIAIGRTSVSTESQAHDGAVFTLDDGVYGPNVGCGANGTALVGWSAAPYLQGGDLVVASLDPCGNAHELFRHDGGRHGYSAPLSPSFAVGKSGALMHWRLEWNHGSGVATLDERGELVADVIDPDYDGDGAYELPVDACPLPSGGYALLAFTGRPHPEFDGGNLLVAHVGVDALPVDVRVLGPIADFRAAWLACDGRGRAHVAWDAADDASYAAVAF